ncbi:LysR family transcriptional regulator [Pseudoxanthomonas broegbernensis]|uniref:LysR family transcriptional regulator n=1 Tax=Pseudoxanthomonas broegbernensis TaxID=83619 RepID=A0A7V8K755_9GAMM|nr:LysR substrate-binding domain-containing protein [Pseudoxanthomonas broegbernensis]KAF1686168.1 LysR family transcriptional regulator [Pseudoxanthomonas broegbernensis]MBB6063874.1 DNA-binding transcriptional LysR family regulator [Pseudoxanthomonas broegbernensis]
MVPSIPWFVRARLKTRQLMLLIAIDEEGNIHRAAETLAMSQPAASKLLKDLEEMMGVPLFERLPRGMRPTWYGETMIRHARIALSSLGEAGAEIEAIRNGWSGSVAIGAIAGPAMSLLPATLAGITRRHPNLRVSLLVESSDVLLERLEQNRLDFLIARLFPRHDKRHLHYQALAEEEICAIARPGHPVLSLARPGLRELAQAHWIVPPEGSVLRHRFELMFQSAGLQPPRQVIATTALMFLTKMLRESDYLAVMPVDVARHYADHGMVSIVPVELSCRMDAFGLITRSDWLLSPGVRTVLQAVREAAAEIYGTPSA